MRDSGEVLRSVVALPEYDSNFEYHGFAQAPEELSVGEADNSGVWKREQISPNYEEMLQSLLDTIEMGKSQFRMCITTYAVA